MIENFAMDLNIELKYNTEEQLDAAITSLEQPEEETKGQAR